METEPPVVNLTSQPIRQTHQEAGAYDELKNELEKLKTEKNELFQKFNQLKHQQIANNTNSETTKAHSSSYKAAMIVHLALTFAEGNSTSFLSNIKSFSDYNNLPIISIPPEFIDTDRELRIPAPIGGLIIENPNKQPSPDETAPPVSTNHETENAINQEFRDTNITNLININPNLQQQRLNVSVLNEQTPQDLQFPTQTGKQAADVTDPDNQIEESVADLEEFTNSYYDKLMRDEFPITYSQNPGEMPGDMSGVISSSTPINPRVQELKTNKQGTPNPKRALESETENEAEEGKEEEDGQAGLDTTPSRKKIRRKGQKPRSMKKLGLSNHPVPVPQSTPTVINQTFISETQGRETIHLTQTQGQIHLVPAITFQSNKRISPSVTESKSMADHTKSSASNYQTSFLRQMKSK